MMVPPSLPVPSAQPWDFWNCRGSLWSTVLDGFVSCEPVPVAGTLVTAWYLCCPVLSLHGLLVGKLLQPTDLSSPLPLDLFKVGASVVVLWAPQEPGISCSLILWAFLGEVSLQECPRWFPTSL